MYWDVLGRTTTLQPTAEEPGATGTSWGRGRTRWASVWPRGVTRGCHHGGWHGGVARVLPGEEGQVVLAEAAGAAWGLCAGHDVLEPRGHVHLQRLVAFDEVVLLGGQGGKRGD